MSELSPAALTVWSAFLDRYEWEVTTEELFAVAAVLRAAADQLSKEVESPKVDGSKYVGLWHSFDYLNSIATELEAQ